MELHKLKAEEIKGFDAAKLRETEAQIRRELLNVRMDIYTAKAAHGAKIKGLKKSLARLLTVATANRKASAPAAAPKAAKPAAEAKAAKPKAAKAPKADAKPKAAKATPGSEPKKTAAKPAKKSK